MICFEHVAAYCRVQRLGIGRHQPGILVDMLTRKQYELLRFISERLKESGVPPSFDEMKDMLGSGEHYALEVRGDSMVDAGILDGDMALIQRNESCDTGDIVVALIDDEEATLKRFRRRGASIALEPANAAYEVRILPPNRVKIQGKLIGLYRKY